MAPKKTMIIGASDHPNRYSFVAANRLANHGHPLVLIGKHPGQVANQPIELGLPTVQAVDTVSLYINPKHQPAYYDYIIQLRPKRVIFNPGTENPEFALELQKQGIEILEACTLVMLATRQF